MSTKSKIKCLIVEDEPVAAEQLAEYVDRVESLSLVGMAGNALEALSFCQEKQPDLIFLDIELPRFSGYEFLDQLKKPLPLIIVTSAKPEHAEKGYEYESIHFLRKIYTFEKFEESIRRVENRLGVNRNDFIDQSGEDAVFSDLTLTVWVDRKQESFPYSTIQYFESWDNYVKIFQDSGRPTLTKMTMKNLMDRLPREQFVQINRRFIINNDRIFRSSSTQITLKSGVELPVGPKYRLVR